MFSQLKKGKALGKVIDISFRFVLAASLGKNFTKYYRGISNDSVLQVVAPAWWGHFSAFVLEVYDPTRPLKASLQFEGQKTKPLLRLFVKDRFPYISLRSQAGLSHKITFVGLFWRRSPKDYTVVLSDEARPAGAPTQICARVLPVYAQTPRSADDQADQDSTDAIVKVAKSATADSVEADLRPFMEKHIAKTRLTSNDWAAMMLIFTALRVNFMSVYRATRALHLPQVQRLHAQVSEILAPDFLGPHSYSRRLSDMKDQELIVELKEVFEFFKEQGIVAFLNSGTFLGAVRGNDFIGHDDDIDLAILVPGNSMDEIGLAWRKLRVEIAKSYPVTMKRTFASLYLSNGVYVDLFPAWVLDGNVFVYPYCVGELTEEQVFPLVTANLRGQDFPAPANFEAVLSLNYGPNWRRPDPNWQFDWVGRATKFKKVMPHLLLKDF